MTRWLVAVGRSVGRKVEKTNQTRFKTETNKLSHAARGGLKDTKRDKSLTGTARNQTAVLKIHLCSALPRVLTPRSRSSGVNGRMFSRVNARAVCTHLLRHLLPSPSCFHLRPALLRRLKEACVCNDISSANCQTLLIILWKPIAPLQAPLHSHVTV